MKIEATTAETHIAIAENMSPMDFSTKTVNAIQTMAKKLSHVQLHKICINQGELPVRTLERESHLRV